MSISLKKYINITSGVGAGASVATRELIARLFTTNSLVPTGSFIEFTSADVVGTYFGTTSTEYKRAVFYFGWVSKNITAPQKISFARWVDTDVGSHIFGKTGTYAVSTFTSITNGDLSLTMGGFTFHVTGLNFTSAVSLANVASTLQTAIRAETGGGAAWTGATVTFDVTRQSFDLVSGATGADTISVAAGTTHDVATLLGWLTGAILSNGAITQTISGVLAQSYSESNNFGSFAFVPTLNQSQIVEAATWNNSLIPNIQFIYSVPCTASNYAALQAALADIGGVSLTLTDPTNYPNEYDEMCPMMIEAATDYLKPNSTQNYDFQQFNLTAKVTDDTTAAIYDALNINYYGQTQTAGQKIALYQDGVMQGLPVDPADQNVYVNEIWLKDAMAAAIMTLLLAMPKVSANNQGRAQLLAIVQSIIQQALSNGTISVGKPLTTTQQLYIAQVTNDTKAWQQVQNIGYWINVVFTQVTVNGILKYKASYTLVYSKDDVIRQVVGTDILI